jgi:hypothetical protein
MAIRQSLGFGFIPEETKHHFLVVIPRIESESVTVYESFEWEEKPEKQSYDESRKKVVISREKWRHIKEPLQKEFNKRLKVQKLTVGKWSFGQVPVERLFGKELVLLLWAIEDCDPTVIPTAVRNWLGLTKEERWWLFTMTNASTGHASDKRGWRKAVRFALTENPVEESATQRNIIEELFRQHAQN